MCKQGNASSVLPGTQHIGHSYRCTSDRGSLDFSEWGNCTTFPLIGPRGLFDRDFQILRLDSTFSLYSLYPYVQAHSKHRSMQATIAKAMPGWRLRPWMYVYSQSIMPTWRILVTGEVPECDRHDGSHEAA